MLGPITKKGKGDEGDGETKPHHTLVLNNPTTTLSPDDSLTA